MFGQGYHFYFYNGNMYVAGWHKKLGYASEVWQGTYTGKGNKVIR